VHVLGANGRVTVRDDPFLPPASITQEPVPVGVERPPIARVSQDRTVSSELARLYHAHQITRAEYRHYNSDWNSTLNVEHGLGGTAAVELEAVIENLHAIAANGLLIQSRLPVLFETLDRNRQWWTHGGGLSYGDRVEFAGSQIVWEYYPGQGIELQVLGTFGKVNSMFSGGQFRQMRELVDEMIPMAANRGGGVAWEYYFSFDGGTPPWTSAMSQGTAIQALSQVYWITKDRSYLDLAQKALPIFGEQSPVGVEEPMAHGHWYLLYSFAPGALVINGFLQSLIGLYDYAQFSGSKQAAHLFAIGDSEARAALPSYDTGGWSLYQPGVEDSLDYHELVTQFAQQLCDRTHARVYCRTAARFEADLTTPPPLALLTHQAKRGVSELLSFRVARPAHVGITILLGSGTVFLTSASFSHGVHTFSIPGLQRVGRYTVVLTATDLAGNYNKITSWLQVTR
jgi:D-glucuronyl C5-epimerase C-terminus